MNRVAGTSVPATNFFGGSGYRLTSPHRAAEIHSTGVAFSINPSPFRNFLVLRILAVSTCKAGFFRDVKFIEKSLAALSKIQRKHFLFRISLCKSAR